MANFQTPDWFFLDYAEPLLGEKLYILLDPIGWTAEEDPFPFVTVGFAHKDPEFNTYSFTTDEGEFIDTNGSFSVIAWRPVDISGAQGEN